MIARIHFEGGLLMLPSQTPYEIENVLESLEWYAGRQGNVGVEIDGQHWRVEQRVTAGSDQCRHCRNAPATLTFVHGRRVAVCEGCARAALGSRFASWPPPEPGRRRAATR